MRTSRISIRVQLDWTPNTNHTGASTWRWLEGWYEEEGVVSRDSALQRGERRLCWSPKALPTSRSRLRPSVPFSPCSRVSTWSASPPSCRRVPTEIAVLEDGPIQRLRDMDGQTLCRLGFALRTAPVAHRDPGRRRRGHGGTGRARHRRLRRAPRRSRPCGRDLRHLGGAGLGSARASKYRTWRHADFGVPGSARRTAGHVGRDTRVRKQDALVRFMRATRCADMSSAVEVPRPEAAQTVDRDRWRGCRSPNPELVYALGQPAGRASTIWPTTAVGVRRRSSQWSAISGLALRARPVDRRERRTRSPRNRTGRRTSTPRSSRRRESSGGQCWRSRASASALERTNSAVVALEDVSL